MREISLLLAPLAPWCTGAVAAKHPDADFRESYADWKKAFALCANGGAIVFHRAARGIMHPATRHVGV